MIRLRGREQCRGLMRQLEEAGMTRHLAAEILLREVGEQDLGAPRQPGAESV